jgi:transcriptional regulator with XRE-family HTH domain
MASGSIAYEPPEPLRRPDGGPTVLRMMLGAQLRRLREARGASPEEAGEAIRGTRSKISRLELGRSSFKQRDVADLLAFYQVTDEREREALLALARQANAPGWWHQYADLMPTWLETYIGLEEAASVIRTYEMQFVHGLLQTSDYARAVVRLRHEETPESEVTRRVDLRLHRQRLLTMAEGPQVWSVVDESALRRPYGGRDVMRAQLKHLIEIAAHPSVTLQVMPFSAGGHAAAGGPFTILRFPQPDLPDVIYLEQLTSALYLDKPTDVDDYTDTMNQLCVDAAQPDKTEAMLKEILDET